MQDIQLYQQILGLKTPWRVSRVEFSEAAGEVRVRVEHEAEAGFLCSECGAAAPIHDHAPERTWRHLDTCQYRTLIVASVPRVRCQEHGVRVARVDWAEPHSRFTALFERLVIDWLRAASQIAVARRMGLSWDEVHGVMERAVQRGLKRRKAEAHPRIGIDEKSFRKGHRYVTVVSDATNGTVLHVADGRKEESLDGFWKSLTAEQINSIEGVAMDMWAPYEKSVRANVPDADRKIVFDKFHIAAHLGEAVDRVRRKEAKKLAAESDDRLKKTRYLWLRNPNNMKAEEMKEFKALRDSNLTTALAWALKEQFMGIWDYSYARPARRYFTRWYNWVKETGLTPMVEKAEMLKKRLENILTYLELQLTNARSEAVNSKVQWVKYMARGFRKQENFITAIYFHCGGLNLYPLATK
jgi:transposase